MQGLATKGQCSIGWFFGLTLHLIINDKGEILDFVLTPGNVDDRKPLSGTNLRKNMKNSLMHMSDKILLRKRALVETVVDELKNICQIEHVRHRSSEGFMENLISGLIVYSYLPKKLIYCVCPEAWNLFINGIRKKIKGRFGS